MVKRLIRWSLVTTIVSGIVFALAGSWRDPWLWAYAAVWAGTTFYAFTGVDDDLLRERFRPPSSGADRVALAFVRLFALAMVVLGSLDAGRWHMRGIICGSALCSKYP